MKTNFIRKASNSELLPKDEFIIEKTIIIEPELFNTFVKEPLNDYDFIREHVDLMYCDQDKVFHCIFITSAAHDFGILVESEGYHYARYAAYLPKAYLN